jgi:hypothetical protein
LETGSEIGRRFTPADQRAEATPKRPRSPIGNKFAVTVEQHISGPAASLSPVSVAIIDLDDALTIQKLSSSAKKLAGKISVQPKRPSHFSVKVPGLSPIDQDPVASFLAIRSQKAFSAAGV